MVTLTWKGDELFLGATKMAEVMPVWPSGPSAHQYVIGPEDHVSEPYQDKEDARNDCYDRVRSLLKRASA